MGKKLTVNPTTGQLDFVDSLSPAVYVGKTIQNVTTTVGTITVVPDSVATTIDTVMTFKTTIVGRGVTVPGDKYHYEIEGSVDNDNDTTLTLGSIVGTTYHEDDVLGNDATTGHPVSVAVTGTDIDYSITTGIADDIAWELTTVLTEV